MRQAPLGGAGRDGLPAKMSCTAGYEEISRSATSAESQFSLAGCGEGKSIELSKDFLGHGWSSRGSHRSAPHPHCCPLLPLLHQERPRRKAERQSEVVA